MTLPTSKKRVLVVEDNEDVRNIICLYLKRNGYTIAEAIDGNAGLQTLTTFQPDVVLLDVLLPRLDGIETLKRIRQLSEHSDVPVIMMSAVLQTKDLKVETARLHVSSFLQKPFQMRTVIDHIESALSQSPSRQAPVGQQDPPREKGRRIHMERRNIPQSGNLEQVTIPELLNGIFVVSRTGQLQICSGSTEKRVFFQNGMPVYAESSLPEETLGAHLVRKKKISQTQHNKALAQMTRTGRHFGEVLLKLGLLGPHELFTEIESHLMNKVISIFNWSEGTYHFEEGDNWKDEVIVARMTPGRILLDGIQRYWTPSRIQKWLGINDSSETVGLDASPYLEDHLGLSTQEARVLRLARRGTTIIDIIRQVKDINLITGTLFALYIMEHIGFVLDDGGEDLSPLDSSASQMTDGAKDDRAKALLSEYIKLRTADYFKLLGVSRQASVTEITEAFKTRQQRYHPDTLIGIDTGLIHEKVEELYVRIHNAYRTLVDPAARKRYVQRLDQKVESVSMSPARSRLKQKRAGLSKKRDLVLFEEGFLALRNGDFGRAQDLFGQAHALSPSPRYQAYHAWASYLSDPIEQQQTTEQLLNKLHDEQPEEVLFVYLLGNLMLREKKEKKATAYFMQAVKLDPQHIDSARQLRLLRLRHRSSETSGLFDIFRKKRD